MIKNVHPLIKAHAQTCLMKFSSSEIESTSHVANCIAIRLIALLKQEMRFQNLFQGQLWPNYSKCVWN